MRQPTQRELIELTSQLRAADHKLTLNQAMKIAIQQLVGASAVHTAEGKKKAKFSGPTLTDKSRDKPPVPEHIKINIARVKKADLERKRIGSVLPTASFVSGGKVSPK